MNIKIPPGLVDSLRGPHYMTVLTGAGISAESGVPTFREAQTGLWVHYRPEDLATPQAFRAAPQLVWDWYQWRRGLVSEAEPNPGHYALAEIETSFTCHASRFTLITQNVDGLHQRAGSQNVIELHGNIMRNKCLDCNRPAGAIGHLSKVAKVVPHCPHCGGLLRPDVVWFGESLPPDALQAAWESAKNCDVFFSIGTSAVVQPAASLPIIARQNGAILVEVNPGPTPLTGLATYILQGLSGEVLPALVEAMTRR